MMTDRPRPYHVATPRPWPPRDSPYRMIAESGRTEAEAMATVRALRIKREIDEAYEARMAAKRRRDPETKKGRDQFIERFRGIPKRRDDPPEPVAADPAPGPKGTLRGGATVG